MWCWASYSTPFKRSLKKINYKIKSYLAEFWGWKIVHVKKLVQCLVHGRDSVNDGYSFLIEAYYVTICISSVISSIGIIWTFQIFSVLWVSIFFRRNRHCVLSCVSERADTIFRSITCSHSKGTVDGQKQLHWQKGHFRFWKGHSFFSLTGLRSFLDKTIGFSTTFESFGLLKAPSRHISLLLLPLPLRLGKTETADYTPGRTFSFFFWEVEFPS